MIDKVRKAFEDRARFEALWEEVYRLYAPDRGGFQTRVYYDDLYREVYDSTPIIAAQSLAATLVDAITPPMSRWMRLEPSTKVPEAQRDAMQRGLDVATEVLFDHITRSGYNLAIQPAMLDLVIGGTGALKIIETTTGFKVKNVPLRSIAIQDDSFGDVMAVYERLWVTGAELVTHRFWSESLTSEERERYADAKSLEVYSCVMRDDSGPKTKWLYKDLLKGRDKPLREAEFETNPYVVFRYAKVNDEPYGRSPALMMYGDVRALNKARELNLKAAAFAALGVWAAKADGVLNPFATQLRPGAVVPVNDISRDNASLRRLDPGAQGVLIGERLVDDLKDSIRRGFMSDQLSGSRMTAQEVVAKLQESARELGVVVARITEELLTPFISTAIKILKRKKVLPKISRLDVGDMIEVNYVSALAMAQRSKEAVSLFELSQIAATLQQIDHAAGYVINHTEVMREIAASRSVPGAVVRTRQEAERMAKEDAQAIAAAQQSQPQ